MSAREIFFLSEPNDVLVADFAGNLDTSNGGGNSNMVAKRCDFSGSIIYGAVRDVGTIRELDYPVWSCGLTPMSGKYRLESIEINGAVTVHDIVVYPGDMALADDSGVAFIPPEHVKFVIESAEADEVRGAAIRDLLLARAPIEELKKVWFRKKER
jgi:regulator of RNase E activity RraA